MSSSNNVSEMSVNFNASIQVTELLMKTLENVAKELASRCIRSSAERHGFNADEEIRTLGLENLNLIRKQMARKAATEKPLKEKKVRSSPAPKEKKTAFPMPFIADCVDESGCLGLAYNRGLFTQCQKKCMENGTFCKGCQVEADKNASGCPDCGIVEQRLATGLYEFTDPKGRHPTSYLKVLEKFKMSKEQVEAEASKLNISIPSQHFDTHEKAKKSTAERGRPPKKVRVIQAENVDDLFSKLSSGLDGEEDDSVVTNNPEEDLFELEEDLETEVEVKSKKSKSSTTDAEKEANKLAAELDRVQKKAEREAKLAAEKAEKEAKRQIEKAEREAKLAAEKVAKAAEKAAKDAEKAAEKAAKDAEKAAEKAAKDAEKAAATKAPAKAAKVSEAVKKPAAAAEPAKKVQVSRLKIGDITYLKSSNNTLYNMETKEAVGTWDPKTETFTPLPEEDDEEDEDQYED
jgi:chemotaxis protein histidine kinase CheA